MSGAPLGQWRSEHSGRVGKFLRSNRRKVARTEVGTFVLDTKGESGGSARWIVAPPEGGAVGGDGAAEGGGMTGIGGISPIPRVTEPGSFHGGSREIPPIPSIPPRSLSDETEAEDSEWVDDPPGFNDVEGF